MVDTSDQWIRTRTGIEERHILQDDEKPSKMAVEAGREAIESSEVSPSDLDLVLVATNVSDLPIPGSAPFLAQELDLREEIPFFDMKAGCTGFIYGLDIASKYLLAPEYHHLLLVGLEALSRVIDWNDRETCVLFGDGAGAAVISDNGGGHRIISSTIHGDPAKAGLLRLEVGGTRHPRPNGLSQDHSNYLQMEGKGVFKSAVNMMERASARVLADAGLSVGDIDWVVPHQANIRIIRKLSNRLGVGMDSVVTNLNKYANTSTATIPLALREAIEESTFDPGDRILLTAFGAGATYGATLLEW